MSENTTLSSPLRKGRFLWMEDTEKQHYLADLKRRITGGYFSSDQIVAQIVEDLAPAINDSVDREISFMC